MFSAVFTSLAYLLSTAIPAHGNCGVPDAVNNLKAQNITNTSTHLSWDPPASTECTDHYKIVYCSYPYNGAQACANKTVVLPLNSTQYDITDLEPCSYSLVQLYTVGTDGSEINTDLILYTGSGDPPKLYRVNLRFVGATNITIDWDRPRGYNYYCYPGFRVCYSAKGDSQETCTNTASETFSTMSVASLSPCTEYNFSVVVVDGNFAADSKMSEKTYASVVTAPQMPNITANVSNYSAHVTWEALDALSTTCAANYLVENCQITGPVYQTDCKTVFSETLPANSTGVTINNLGECTNNYVSVTLVGRNGYSTSNQLVALEQNLDTPVPSDVDVTFATTSQFTVNYYKRKDDCVTSFRVCWFKKDEIETCLVTDHGYPTTFKNLSLTTCSNYTLHFTTLGQGGRPSKNVTIPLLTGPDNVLDLDVQPSPHSALVSWRPAPSALQCGTNYYIVWEKSFSDPQRAQPPVNTTSLNITGLSSCAEYSLLFTTDGTSDTSSGRIDDVFYTTQGDVGPITSFKFHSYPYYYYLDIDIPDESVNCVKSFVTCWYETAASQAGEQCQERKEYWDKSSLKVGVNYTVTVTATLNYNKTISGSTTFIPVAVSPS